MSSSGFEINNLKLKIELLHPLAHLPKKAHLSDACFDLAAAESLVIAAGATAMVSLGWAMQLEEGWEAVIRGRSGLASKGIIAHLGTIDHLYRKEVKVILHNFSGEEFHLAAGDRIAQMSFAPVYPVAIVQAKIEPSPRGGFGSTGTS